MSIPGSLGVAGAEVERRAQQAWPAAEVVKLDGWWLRTMAGVTRRANSVFPEVALGTRPLHARIDAVEQHYRQRSLVPRFHVSPYAQPTELEAALQHRGYRVDGETSLMWSPVRPVCLLPSPGCQLSSSPSDPWLQLAVAQGRYAGRQQVYLGLLGRLGRRALFALAWLEGRPAATALAVVQPPFMGIFSMVTQPTCRRRGLAKRLLGALAQEAAKRDVPYLYLQVEQDNVAAQRLYRSAGFLELCRYHYRTLAAPG